MASIVVNGNTSGAVTLSAPAVAGTVTVTLPSASGTMASLASVTANGVAYINSSGQPTSGSALVFDGTNLGVGVTPLSWSGYKSLDLQGGSFASGSGTNVEMWCNSFYNGTNSVYRNTGAATLYNQSTGAHRWYNAASGTAGNAITFTQAMTLDASGNLALGSTTSLSSSSNRVDLTVNGTSSSMVSFGTGGTRRGYALHDATDFSIASETAGALRFLNNGSERARIDSSGNLLVGTTTNFSTRLVSFATNNAFGAINTTSGSTTTYIWNQGTSGNNIFTEYATETSAYTARGNITYNRAGGLVAYNTTSDYRAKDISGPVTGSGSLIDSVPVYMGTMKGATQERPMFIAHETPVYAHTGEKDAVDKDGNPIYQQMDVSALVPVMWAEIQSLRKRLAALESA